MAIWQAFIKRMEQDPDTISLRAKDLQMTHAEIYRAACGVAQTLGDGRGRHIAVLSGNTTAFPIGMLGVFAAGGITVPLNAMLKPAELLPQLLHVEADTLLVSSQLAPLAQGLQANGFGGTVHVIDEIAPADALPTPPTAAQDELAMILYTSGTTDDPKGVMLTHGNLLDNYASFSQVVDFAPGDTHLVVLPLFHVFAFTTAFLPWAISCGTLLLCPGFNPKLVFGYLQTEKSVLLMAVPPMYGILAQAAPEDLQIRDNLKLAVSGGGPMAPHIQQAFESRLGVEIREGYGLTEAAPVVSVNLKGAGNKRATIGPALPGVQVEIFNENGEALPADTEGELVVKGPNVMQGYWKNKSATEAALPDDGWLRTGDLAIKDTEGYLRIVGRKKELIISAGENIHPREIEDVLVTHPQVFAAAVVGMPHPRKTEVPAAHLAPLPDTATESIDIQSVEAHLRQRLAPHKIPHRWTVHESLPLQPTGKVDKRALLAE